MSRFRAHMTATELEGYRSAVKAFERSPEGRQMAREKAAETSETLELVKEIKRLYRRKWALKPDTPAVRMALEIWLEALDYQLFTFGWDEERLQRDLKRWIRMGSDARKDDAAREELLRRAKEVPMEEAHAFENVRRNGNRSTARCPFHAERTASFTIFHDDNHGHCYGCQWHGDVVDLRRQLHQETFSEAVRALAV